MCNKTEQIVIMKEGDDVLGYILPGERCLLSEEQIVSMGHQVPDETPCNVEQVNNETCYILTA